MFHRLRGGRDEAAIYGLKSWYPNAKDEGDEVKKPKRKSKNKKAKPKSPKPVG